MRKLISFFIYKLQWGTHYSFFYFFISQNIKNLYTLELSIHFLFSYLVTTLASLNLPASLHQRQHHLPKNYSWWGTHFQDKLQKRGSESQSYLSSIENPCIESDAITELKSIMLSTALWSLSTISSRPGLTIPPTQTPLWSTLCWRST